ncbi:MAG TPA: helix-turn-helix transcriptional regulator, partial [Acidobacteriota bacterium]|nr:helix-turn-helix transcriptional regulator [Acidobacteriota bacterium]
MKKPNQPLAEQIRRMRCRQGLNLRQVAMLSGIAESTFKCLESSRMRFNVDTLLRVQLALGLPISHLWPYRITEKKQVCEESLQAAVLSADLAWKPSVEWVLSQVVEVCKVDLKEVTNQRSTDPRILNART